MFRLILILAFLAAQPALAEVVAHKGRSISVGTERGADQFLDLARRGIDMVARLPPDLRALGEAVKDLRYLPAPESVPDRAVADNITGVYTMASPEAPGAYIAFRRNPAFLAPMDIALSLVGNGVTARRHQEYLALRAKGGDAGRQAWLKTVLTRSNPDVVVKAECENLTAILRTLKALDVDPRKTEGLNRLLSRRGC